MATSITSDIITIADGETETYGVGGSIPQNTLSAYNTHRVKVLSGQVSVGNKDTPSETANVINGAKTSAIQDIYTLPGTAQFEFMATGDSEVIIVSTR
jgi:hypothetical protein